MNNELVPYRQAYDLREIGFDEPCLMMESLTDYFLEGRHMPIPTYRQAFKWFREATKLKWNIETWVQPFLSTETRKYEAFYWKRGEACSIGIYGSHEEAELESLKKLIQIVKTTDHEE